MALLLAVVVAAQAPGVHPISGRRFAPVMGYQGADWLERSERDEEEAPDIALNVLKIPRGASVAENRAISARMRSRSGTKSRWRFSPAQPWWRSCGR